LTGGDPEAFPESVTRRPNAGEDRATAFLNDSNSSQLGCRYQGALPDQIAELHDSGVASLNQGGRARLAIGAQGQSSRSLSFEYQQQVIHINQPAAVCCD
jgi:hypothetical protein